VKERESEAREKGGEKKIEKERDMRGRRENVQRER